MLMRAEIQRRDHGVARHPEHNFLAIDNNTFAAPGRNIRNGCHIDESCCQGRGPLQGQVDRVFNEKSFFGPHDPCGRNGRVMLEDQNPLFLGGSR